MNTIRQCLGLLATLWFAHVFGNSTIGQQHEFLDELIGIALPLEVSTCGTARFVDVEVQLFAFKLHGTVLEALLTQLLGQHIEQQKFFGILAFEVVWCQMLVAIEEVRRRTSCAILHPVLFQEFLHLLIGIATVGTNDRVDNPMGAHLCILVEQEDDAVAQFLLVGTQRANEIAKVFGQHGNGTIDEIDRGGTLLCLLVDDTALGDVVRNVGYVDADLEQLAFLAYREGVIEILCIVGVDGTCPNVAEVLAGGQVLRRHLARYLLRSLLDLLRILVRQPVLSQDGMHLCIVLAFATKNVNDLAHHVSVRGIGPLRDANQCLVIVLATLQLVLRDENILGDEVVLSDEEGNIASHTQSTDERFLGALQYFQHLCLLDMIATAGHRGETDVVAVLCPERVALRNENGLVAVVWND